MPAEGSKSRMGSRPPVLWGIDGLFCLGPFFPGLRKQSWIESIVEQDRFSVLLKCKILEFDELVKSLKRLFTVIPANPG
jgi:hypothetical protein